METNEAVDQRERLNKILARAGLGSRRECDELIAAGRVTVDGERVTDMGVKVDPRKSKVCCDGEAISAPHYVYYLLNKPKGYLCTNKDEQDRPKAIDLLRTVSQRVFPVGRLDEETEGLLILTNDGELANLLTHPRYKVPKTYLAMVKGELTRNEIRQLEEGVRFSEGKTGPAKITVVGRAKKTTTVEVTIDEGRNRQVRRMFAKVSHPVKYLRRIQIGRLADHSLKAGRYRKLTRPEVAMLYKAAGRAG